MTHPVSWVLCGPVASGVSELYGALLNPEVTTPSPALDRTCLPGFSLLHSGLCPEAPAPLKVSTSIFGKGHSWFLIQSKFIILFTLHRDPEKRSLSPFYV